ncbi:VCBS repeat-containing protein [Asanoa siamensis]|uniref:FG-GAP repeat protein n=1 Tax=Asanoa siamensis TaxID=926357 RepID=A0ABQ4CW42_9ACTN|nr:VCBS repeat-containing protein [Asanoa siamensis]GIF75233.1 hypothetical protein Asi02nite_47510 [Asanoa siamensis]
MVLLLLAAGLTMPASTVVPPAVAALPCAPAKGSESQAVAEARRCGTEVAVTGLTTGTTEVVARADGQLEATVHAGIVRVRRGDAWVPVDLTLAPGADGAVTAKADPFDVRVSGERGAGGELASLAGKAGRVSLGWAGALPAPTLTGNRATYVDALPGVDLVVDVRRTGLETLFVVKDRAALPHVRRLSLAITGGGVAGHRVDAGGATALVDAAGRTVATVPALEMWDAKTTRLAPQEPPTVRVASTMERTAEGVALALTPDEKWLSAPERAFPITIDPEINPVQDTFDTWIRAGTTADQSTAEDLRVGREGSTGPVTRTLVRWHSSAFVNTQVTSATSYFYNWYSYSPGCVAAAWQVWNTSAFDATTRWANQPTWLDNDPNTAGDQPAGTSTATRGYDANCDDAWVSVTSTNFFSRVAREGQANGYMGIRAADETVVGGFKQFRSDNSGGTQTAYSRVVYNRLPTAASLATTPTSTCTGTVTSLGTMTPTLKVTAADPDGGNLTVRFEWWTQTGTSALGTTAPVTVASGAVAQAAIPAGGVPLAGTYRWRALVADATYTTYSPFCTFALYEFAPPAVGCVAGAENDYNGDGVTDVVIADPRATVGGVRDAGAVYMVDGAGRGTRTLDESLAAIPGDPGEGDRFGHALATYDANRDGCADLAVGVPYETVAGAVQAGSVRIVFGAPAGLGTGPATISMQQGTDGTPDTPEGHDWFGFALAAGRMPTGEGFLVVGAPGDDISGQTDAGAVHYRRPGVNVWLTGTSPAGANRDDRTGYALAATPYHWGVASPGENRNGQPFAGAVCVLTHTLTGGVPTSITCPSQADTTVTDDPDSNDNFGKSIAMAPYRAPGAPAGQIDSILVVGVPGENQTATNIQDTGLIQQFRVTNTGVTELPWIDQATAGITSAHEEGDYFGEKVHVVNTAPAAEVTTETLLVAVGIPAEEFGPDQAEDHGSIRVFPAGVGAGQIQEVIVEREGSLPGPRVAKELLGTALGGTSQRLYVGAPYGDGTVWAIPWSALAAGSATPSHSWQPGTSGLPTDGVRLGAVIR